MTRAPIVVLGAMTRYPVAGIIWLTMQYVLGFRRLGYDCYYVESHGGTPRPFVVDGDDGAAGAAAFLARIMARFDMSDRWAFQALHTDGRCYGLSAPELSRLYSSAALIVNLHGATRPLPEHAATGRLVYIGTDPVLLEIQLFEGSPAAHALLEPHIAFFTWAGNHGRDDCKLPVSDRFVFHPTRQPLLLDVWRNDEAAGGGGKHFTTIAGWRQLWREISFEGETYHWSKHFEFLKFLGLPSHCSASFELALTGYETSDRLLLEEHGWDVTDATALSGNVDQYRDYIRRSCGEFTVAKDQNVRLRTGWFSDRSAAYLAAGLPVVTQDTGFGSSLPTGGGLFAFSTLEEAAVAVDAIVSDYERHRTAARAIAAEYFDHAVVLPALLDVCGV
jgi:hypothetical protein